VLENHESVYILAPVAGIELHDIDIAVHETTLTISGVRNKPKEFYEHKMQVKNEECFWGKFLRNVILGENMDFSAVKAVMENNLLVIHIPKIRFDSQNIKINRIAS
jgi:HSP20 family molecular chaperone IbpA